MKIGPFIKIGNELKENESIRNFVKELEEAIKNRNFKLPKEKLEYEIGIFEEIKDKYQVSIVSRNTIRDKINEMLSKNMEDNMYFIADKSSNIKDVYVAYKYENGKERVITISKDDLPKYTNINSVLSFQSGKYVIDENMTQYISNEIAKIRNNVLESQDKELREYRKEGHLYMIEENINDRIYLSDITEKNGYSLEEIDFPNELRFKAVEGTVFQYINGRYEFYSDDGFERIYKNNM